MGHTTIDNAVLVKLLIYILHVVTYFSPLQSSKWVTHSY